MDKKEFLKKVHQKLEQRRQEAENPKPKPASTDSSTKRKDVLYPEERWTLEESREFLRLGELLEQAKRVGDFQEAERIQMHMALEKARMNLLRSQRTPYTMDDADRYLMPKALPPGAMRVEWDPDPDQDRSRLEKSLLIALETQWVAIPSRTNWQAVSFGEMDPLPGPTSLQVEKYSLKEIAEMLPQEELDKLDKVWQMALMLKDPGAERAFIDELMNQLKRDAANIVRKHKKK